MDYNKKRLALFEQYARNLDLISHKYAWQRQQINFKESVFCPICLCLYNKDSLEEKTLTLEDVPPYALGGKKIILTCKKCNNSSGSVLDISLVEYLKQQPFINGISKSSIPVKFDKEKADNPFSAKANLTIFDDDRMEFKFKFEKTGDKRVEVFKRLHEANIKEIRFNIISPSVKFVQIALLRIAYLKLYHKFGNTFILNNNYQGIRSQILNPSSSNLASYGVLKSPFDHLPNGIYILREPENLKSFLIPINLICESIKYAFVVLIPSPFADSVRFYDDFSKIITVKYKLDERFKDFDYLNDSAYNFVWLNAFR